MEYASAMSGKKGKGKKTGANERTIENRRARHEYFIESELEVGISLRGTEVKAVRDGTVSLGEGYVTAETTPGRGSNTSGVGLFLHNVMISHYPPAGANQHREHRVRRLMAHKREILKLARAVEQKGMTLVPLKLYFNNGWAKLLIGLARGKGEFDKRHAIKDRENKRELQRMMSKVV